MKYLALVIALAVTGCTPDFTVDTTQSIKGSTEAAEWIIKCAEAANPLSDEEGEDLVYGCAHTAKSIYGNTIYHVYRGGYQCVSPSYTEARDCYITLLETLDI